MPLGVARGPELAEGLSQGGLQGTKCASFFWRRAPGFGSAKGFGSILQKNAGLALVDLPDAYIMYGHGERGATYIRAGLVSWWADRLMGNGERPVDELVS